MLRVANGRSTQYASAFSAMLGMICAGLHMGWSSPAVPKLLNGDAGFQISRDEISWLVSFLNLGSIPGCLLARWTVDRWGRKTTILISAWPYFGAWILIFWSSTIYLLFAAQLLAGLSLGMGLVVTSMYCGEIAEKEIRGALSSTMNFGMNIGSLFSYIIGPYLDYATVPLATVWIPVLFFMTSLFIPESPHYFLIKGDKDAARKSLMRLRNHQSKEKFEVELEEMEISVKSGMEKRSGMKELFSKKMYRRAIFIIIGVRSLQQLCGNMAIVSYMELIFSTTNIELAASLTTILYGVTQVLSGILATVLTDKLGRKPLLYFSTIGHTISLTAIGTYFFLQDFKNLPEDILSPLSWIPLIAIFIFCICYSCGIGSLGYVLLSEYFPTNVRSIAVSFGSIYGSFLAFSVSKSYLLVADSFGVYTAFWIFAVFCCCGVVFTHFFVPETKNKSLTEIQDILNCTELKEKEIENEVRIVTIGSLYSKIKL